MTDQLPAIEGFTPGMLWIFMVVLIGLAALFVLGYKVVDIVRKEIERKKERKEAEKPELADEISSKVIQLLEPRMSEIDRKLENDKSMLDMHTRQINALGTRTDKQESGILALSMGVLALINHTLYDGNADELTNAKTAINDYVFKLKKGDQL